MKRRIVDQRIIFIALACLFVPAILVISFLPYGDKHLLHTRGRYHSWGHLIAFSAIAFIAAGTARSLRGRILLFLASLLLGLGIEIGEHFVYQGALEWKDVLVDTIGVIGGTLIAMLITPRETNSVLGSP
jgi:hypothetical protein